MESLQRRSILKNAGWTPVPNWVLDNIHRFDGVQFRLLMFIIRRLYGWDTPREDFSVRFLSSNTGIPRSTVQRHIRLMIAAGILLDAGRGVKGSRRLRIQERCPTGRDAQETREEKFPQPVSPPVPPMQVQKSYHPPGQDKNRTLNKSFQTHTIEQLLDPLKNKISQGSFQRLIQGVHSTEGQSITVVTSVPLYLADLIRKELGMEVFFQQAI